MKGLKHALIDHSDTIKTFGLLGGATLIGTAVLKTLSERRKSRVIDQNIISCEVIQRMNYPLYVLLVQMSSISSFDRTFVDLAVDNIDRLLFLMNQIRKKNIEVGIDDLLMVEIYYSHAVTYLEYAVYTLHSHSNTDLQAKAERLFEKVYVHLRYYLDTHFTTQRHLDRALRSAPC